MTSMYYGKESKCPQHQSYIYHLSCNNGEIKSIKDFLYAYNIPQENAEQYKEVRDILNIANKVWLDFCINDIEWMVGPGHKILVFTKDYFDLLNKKIDKVKYNSCLYELLKGISLKNYKKILNKMFKISYNVKTDLFDNLVNEKVIKRIIFADRLQTPSVYIIKNYRFVRKELI